jgi:hypothetical protein
MKRLIAICSDLEAEKIKRRSPLRPRASPSEKPLSQLGPACRLMLATTPIAENNHAAKANNSLDGRSSFSAISPSRSVPQLANTAFILQRQLLS